jgi:hypothetical protein
MVKLSSLKCERDAKALHGHHTANKAEEHRITHKMKSKLRMAEAEVGFICPECPGRPQLGSEAKLREHWEALHLPDSGTLFEMEVRVALLQAENVELIFLLLVFFGGPHQRYCFHLFEALTLA